MLMEAKEEVMVSRTGQNWLRRALRVEWLGQTAASVFWIVSVFTYGISCTGDWLQLCAASAWLVANLAALSASEQDEASPANKHRNG